MKRIDILDLIKIILSIFLVAIHCQLFPMFLYPWLRLAVPLFFIISSYLLFSKINNSPKIEKKQIIRHYILRLCKLYLFWFIVLLPITFYVRRNIFDNGILVGVLKTLLSGSTFIASWYIFATIIGTILIDYLSNKLNNKVLLLLVVFAYIICCLTSSYTFILEKNSIINNFFSYLNLVIEPQFSFLVSLIYIYYGKLFAEGKKQINKRLNVILIILFCILLYCEWFFIYKSYGFFNKDCYIFIAPAALLIFNYVKNIKVFIKNSKLLRQLSSFTYPLHASVITILSYCFKKYIHNDDILSTVCFFATIIVCTLLFLAIKKLEKKIKVLKYSY